jgi:phosphatidylserine synthase
MGSPSFHEDFGRRQAVQTGSERGFGVVFAAVFATVGLWPLLDGETARTWSLIVAALFAAAAMVAPALLRPFNRLWFVIGLALHKVVSPLVMALLFYLTVTPVALLMRLAGKDPLRLKFDRRAKSYWIERRPPGPAPETMRHQF